MALLINKATTLLSTPPDKAQITLSFFTIFLISLINLIFSEVTCHFFFILQIENKKFLNICFPFSVCVPPDGTVLHIFYISIFYNS